ncbi:MAG: STAS domain-containing protein [Shimia sp.]
MAQGTRVGQVIERLPPRLTAEAMEPLVAHMRRTQAHLTLSGDRVEGLAPLELQALLVLARAQAERGHRFVLADPAPALVDGLAIFGLDAATLEEGTPWH